MSPTKKNFLKTIFHSNIGCTCDKQTLAQVYQPKPKHNPDSKPKSTFDQNPIPCNSSSTTISPTHETSSSSHVSDPEIGEKIGDSIAVVKDSDDPYIDFRNSMLQMIYGKGIYLEDDLQELLDCFLELNSSRYHDVIVRAFMEILNEEISEKVKQRGDPK